MRDRGAGVERVHEVSGGGGRGIDPSRRQEMRHRMMKGGERHTNQQKPTKQTKQTKPTKRTKRREDNMDRTEAPKEDTGTKERNTERDEERKE